MEMLKPSTPLWESIVSQIMNDLRVKGQVQIGTGLLYVESGALKYKSGSGTVTTIAIA